MLFRFEGLAFTENGLRWMLPAVTMLRQRINRGNLGPALTGALFTALAAVRLKTSLHAGTRGNTASWGQGPNRRRAPE